MNAAAVITISLLYASLALIDEDLAISVGWLYIILILMFLYLNHHRRSKV